MVLRARAKNHPEHVLAQRAGRERWYESYSVEIAEVRRADRSGG
jgi:heme-degrading monooxygenase HmoA